MFETASAQPIGLFQSPALSALERLLTGLGGRIGQVENRFLSRQQSFIDRIFSRHFEAIGLPTWQTPVSARAVEPVAMGLPQSWVPSPRALQAAQKGVPRTDSAPLTASPAPLRAPVASRASAPGPMPMLAPAVASAVAASLPVTAGAPAAAGSQESKSGTVPSGAAVPSAGQPAPARVPTQTSDATATTSAPVSAAQHDPSVAVSPVALASAFVPSAALSAPTTALPPTSHALGSALLTAPAEPLAVPSVPPTAAGSTAGPRLAPVVAEAALGPVAAATELRVRDLLRSSIDAAAPPATTATAWAKTSAAAVQPALAAPVVGAGKARSFQHLNWADAQLSHSPLWRAAALPTVRTDAATISGTSAASRMPVLETPELAPSAPRRSTPGPTAVSSVARPVVAAPTIAIAATGEPAKPGPERIVPAPAAAPMVTGSLLPTSGVAEAVQRGQEAPLRLSGTPTPAATPLDALAGGLGLSDGDQPRGLAPARPGEAIQPPATPALPSLDSSLMVEPASAQPVLGRPVPARAGSRSAERPRAILPSGRSSSWDPASEALRVDPGLLPGHATPELAALFDGAEASAPAGSPLAVSWAQPGGIWSQPAWSPTGILARLAQGPLAAHASAWQSAPGVPSVISRTLARPETARAPLAASVRDLPWVAAATAPRAETATGRGPASAVMPAALVSPSQRPVLTAAMRAPVMREVAAAPSADPRLSAAADSPAVSRQQPWRQPGGLGALAELFAAGIGLGSGAAATQAQLEPEAVAPTLLADWIRPLLTLAPLRALVTAGPALAESIGPLALPWLPSPTVRATEQASLAAQSLTSSAASPRREVPISLAAASQAPRIAATSRWPAQVTERPVEPHAESRRDAPAAGTAVAAATPMLLPALQLGGIGLLAQRFAGDQGLRSISPGLPLRADSGVWASAPGLPAGLSHGLSLLAGQSPASSGRALRSEGLPYLSVLPSRDSAPAGRTRSPSSLPSQQTLPSTAAKPSSERPAAAMAPARSPGAVSAVESASGPAAAAPWFAPGGGGTLAELFAAGIGTTSGVTAWLSQAVTAAPGGVVPTWLRSLLATVPSATGLSPELSSTTQAPSQRFEQAAALPWVSPTRRAGTATAAVPTTTATGTLAAGRGPALATMALPRVGVASVRAEQFASQQGLVAPTAEAGHWQPVAGGLVWVASAGSTAAARPAAEKSLTVAGIPAGTPPTPAGAAIRPAIPGLRLGNLALRSELFAQTEQARVLGVGEQLSQSLGLPTAPAPEVFAGTQPAASTAGWRGAGGLIYLPSAQADRKAKPQTAASLAMTSSLAASAPRPVHVSPLSLAQPWASLPRELSRLGLSSLPLPRGAQPQSAGPAVAPTKAASPAGWSETPSTSRMQPAALPFVPVLGGATLRTTPSLELRRPAPTPQVVTAPARQPYELAARFASSMLTAFPQPDAAPARAARDEAAKPAMLWPQSASATGERVQRLLAMLPPAVSSTGPLAALAELTKTAPTSTGVGMPLWQRLPSQGPLSLVAGTTGAVGAADPSDEEAAEHAESERPSLTLISGESGGASRSRRDATSAAPATGRAASPPPVEVFKAALTASGISREQVEASAKLMQAIGAGSSGGGRGDDRLSLDDLTLVAISMGQGRMAASMGSALTSIPSVESALRLPSVQHPTVTQDDKAVRKKIDTMAESVIKMLKQMKDNQAVRGGFDM